MPHHSCLLSNLKQTQRWFWSDYKQQDVPCLPMKYVWSVGSAMQAMSQLKQEVTQIKLEKAQLQTQAAQTHIIESKHAQQAKQAAPERAAAEPRSNAQDAQHGSAGFIKARQPLVHQVRVFDSSCLCCFEYLSICSLMTHAADSSCIRTRMLTCMSPQLAMAHMQVAVVGSPCMTWCLCFLQSSKPVSMNEG